VLQTQPPVIVHVVEQPAHQTSITDLIFGSMATVVVLLLIAAALGVVLGGAIILFKRLRHRDGIDPDDTASSLRITP
jgi:ABC-type nitrate/sulfonate/bicarbonate transport system permease component